MMFGFDPYLVDWTKEHKVREAQKEAEEDRLQETANAARAGRLTKIGHRLLLEMAGALSALGAWLEEQSVVSEQSFDERAKRSS
jgi:hypothetical protein